MGSLEAQLKRLEKSPKFQKMVRDAQKKAVKQGLAFGQGSHALTPRLAREKAEEMRSILFRHTHEVIPSIVESDIEIGNPVAQADGSYSVDIWFNPDRVWRPSLTGEGGVDSIVRLFTRGYDAGATAYGLWHGERVAGRTHLDGDDFMLDAVEEFNRNNTAAEADLNEMHK